MERTLHMDATLNAKVALVTGANRGIGFEVARQLGLLGARVLVGARDEERGREAAGALRLAGINADFVRIDVASESSIASAASFVDERFNSLDVLINNAAVHLELDQHNKTPSRVTSGIFEATFRTNVLGHFLTIRAFLPLLRRSCAARIVNVSSTVGSIGDQSNPESPYWSATALAYNSSKAALNMVTVQFAKELASTSIKVNSACPGWVRTEMGPDRAPRTVEQGARVIVDLATLDETGPTGGFFDADGEVPW
jgi:NAD(P)-dependent dehydrogenase (short-subunit alcohol dehydrogenase family)